MRLRLPLIVLGYGEFTEQKKLLSVEDRDNRRILPVFTDPEAAELYRRVVNQRLLLATLPISVSCPVGLDMHDRRSPNVLNALVVDSLDHARDLLEMVMIAGRVAYVAIDPSPSDGAEPVLCMELDEVLDALQSGGESSGA